MKDYLFLVNPISGGGEGRRFARLIKSFLTSKDYSLFFVPPVDCHEVIRRCGPEYKKIVVVGGDGTFSLVAEIMFQEKITAALALMPVGTGNDMARTLGYYSLTKRQMNKKSIKNLLEAVQEWSHYDLDLWMINNDRFFTNYFGLGLDAAVVKAFNGFRHTAPFLRTRTLNLFIHAIAGFTQYWLKVRSPLAVYVKEAANSTWRELKICEPLTCLLISNTMTYAGGAIISTKASPFDGKLEVSIIPDTFKMAELLSSSFIGKRWAPTKWRPYMVQALEVMVIAPKEQFAQIDGECCDYCQKGGPTLHIKQAGNIKVIASPIHFHQYYSNC